jgi:ankyrin repeat protein
MEVSRLLAEGADPNFQSLQRAQCGQFHGTPLLAAVGHCVSLEVARLLLDGGANPNQAWSLFDGKTPLMCAAGAGYFPMVRLLLSRGAVVNVMDVNGFTAFHFACHTAHKAEGRYVKCLMALLHAGCDTTLATATCPHGRRLTGEQMAEHMGHTGAIDLLRSHGGSTCDGCKAFPVVGLRYAQVDRDYDLCSKCFANQRTEQQTKFERIKHFWSRPSEHNKLHAQTKPRLDAFDSRHSWLTSMSLDEHLSAAAEHADERAVARLLDAGAGVNAVIQGMCDNEACFELHATTVLQAAVQTGSVEAARLMLSAGADPNLNSEHVPLIAAAQYGQLGMLKLLLQHGADVDAVQLGTGHTAFIAACSYEEDPDGFGEQLKDGVRMADLADCVEALLRAGCDFAIRNEDGMTGLQAARSCDADKVVTRIDSVIAAQVQEGHGTGYCRGRGSQMFPLRVCKLANELLCSVKNVAKLEKWKASVAQQLAAGADPSALVTARTQGGSSYALVHAAKWCPPDVVKMLLKAGADPCLEDSSGEIPLAAAAQYDRPQILRLLLAHGATVDQIAWIEPSYWAGTAFHRACQHDAADCVEELLRAGANHELQDRCGETGREQAEGGESR